MFDLLGEGTIISNLINFEEPFELLDCKYIKIGNNPVKLTPLSTAINQIHDQTTDLNANKTIVFVSVKNRSMIIMLDSFGLLKFLNVDLDHIYSVAPFELSSTNENSPVRKENRKNMICEFCVVNESGLYFTGFDELKG